MTRVPVARRVVLRAVVLAGLLAATFLATGPGRAVAAGATAGATPNAATVPDGGGDPTARGPYAVTTRDYNLGTTAFRPASLGGAAVEIAGRVVAPTAMTGRLPLVLLLHGRHETCATDSGSTLLAWPCPTGSTPIPSNTGYDDLAATLASWGYVVVSVSANGVNAADGGVADLGATARADLLDRHLQLWRTWSGSSSGPFGNQFVGHIDWTRLGTFGHSRGGEGVMRQAARNATAKSPWSLKAVYALAPTDFTRWVVTGVPTATLLPVCDGDVSDLQGVHYFDDARYARKGDPASKHTVVVAGANHNFFNRVWSPSSGVPGAIDDWAYTGRMDDPVCGTTAATRLDETTQRRVGLAYAVTFFRRYLGADLTLDPLWTGAVATPAALAPAAALVSWQAPGTSTARRDVNRLVVGSDLTTNALGGAVTRSRLMPGTLCGGVSPQPSTCTNGAAQEPHSAPWYAGPGPTPPGTAMLSAGWSAATGVASFVNAVPAGWGDVRGFTALQFRAAVNPGDHRNPAGDGQRMRVVLADAAGRTASVVVGGPSLAYPAGTAYPLPKLLLAQVRVPLSGFRGVDLGNVRSVRLVFDQRPSGLLEITDLMFTKGAA